MARTFTDNDAKIAAQLGAGRSARSFKFTVDNTLRVVTLGEGGWRLFGHATQVYYLLRQAEDATGTLVTGVSAPVLGDLVGSTAGAAAGKLYSGGDLSVADANSAVRGAIYLPLDTTVYDIIPVRSGCFVNLYAACGTTAAPILIGPYE